MQELYDTLIMITPQDFMRLKANFSRMVELLPVKQLYFVGSEEVGRLVEQYLPQEKQVGFLWEEEILPFDHVENAIRQVVKLPEIPRGFTGWYYQQFLKMGYARMCKDDYYLVWDGDTVPTKPVQMVSKQWDKPFFDVKTEYEETYFLTLSTLFPELQKMTQHSFISEHMLFSTKIMREILTRLEEDKRLSGSDFAERIIKSIPTSRLNGTAFSEFETYGTYVSRYYPQQYRIRRWYSFRNAGQYFEPEKISEEDYQWLARDFDAISFEKGHVVEQGAEFFQNKTYQAKLSARYILSVVQENLIEGNREEWEENSEENFSNHPML